VKENNFKTLYLCYFGLREPLVQTQVLPYLREIKKGGTRVSILTFEPNSAQSWTAEQIKTEKQKLADEGIEWDFLTYHKRPSVPATVYDILCGTLFIRKKLRREKIDVLHARVHVPMIMAALAAKLTGGKKPKMLFDIRGFVPEEYTDAGVWKENGLIYKIFKRLEKWLFKKADGFVVLTEKARAILFPESLETGFDKAGRPVEVIPCCVDFEKRFEGDPFALREQTRRRLDLTDRLVITHLGALGGLYLTDDIADFLQVARVRRPDTFAMFLTQTSPDLIIPLLKARGFTEKDYFVGKIPPAEVQNYLNAADIALSFVKSSYATASRSPTKIPEYLACGLPIVSNGGVGDVDEMLLSERVGVIVDDFSAEEYSRALAKAIDLGAEKDFREKSQASAKNRFDLEKTGGERYRRIYERLLKNLG
jgi:glycosyltransferase involved in cell wall biosynthesis